MGKGQGGMGRGWGLGAGGWKVKGGGLWVVGKKKNKKEGFGGRKMGEYIWVHTDIHLSTTDTEQL